jgi:AcrR family transcriptional regulator
VADTSTETGTDAETEKQAPIRTPRRDAVRNGARILEAAREVLAESGPEASMEGIASRAGVGVGTIYRHYANKDALIDALVGRVIDELDQAADKALAAEEGAGLESFLLALGESFSAHRRYAGLMLGRGDEAGADRIRGYLDELTTRARAAGTLAAETTLGDVMVLVWSLRALVEMTGDIAPDAWRRLLDVQLTGLREPGPSSATPALSLEQVRQISASPTCSRRAG